MFPQTSKPATRAAGSYGRRRAGTACQGLSSTILQELRARAEAYFQAAQRRIGLLYHDNSILAVQCSFLTAVYLMSTMRILAAWKCFAQTGTQYLAWRIHRVQDQGPDAMNQPVPGNDGEGYIAESLYWSCLKSEL
ncbi:unnamed protein product [Parascedosporium putredinis]|uniref:Uncharacterized protein n=1 Tax=Parascedosporium putredinis TaxID=1442378 RepID=A0A9P1MCD0_9PEZI|nr:unnamed protein product [Parascedosporium putredinis]CAI8000391.1 unnamed protein product [Parascedosporium putredinis]